ncbi:MAG: carboxymuconolactone decarboxylase family protein [Mucilaginibacter polytrichastri]|nr:carboxymuconolactone decarboxylase family protein [Mucilaginibacter polytrichastri]
MNKRFNIAETAPEAYKAMYALSNVIASSGLSKTHQELLKIRASQINGCAFCLDMHTRDALKLGETQQRIFLLDAWRETELYTAEERIVLAIAEEVTHIGEKGLSEETYTNAVAIFDEHYVAMLIMAAVTINAWNRIAISTHLPVPMAT